jgi:hypothetical protein
MRSCGTMDVHRRMLDQDGEYRAWRQASEAHAQQVARQGLGQLRTTVTDIPVVVHVVHHPNFPWTNISDAQVHSQIAALNRDFRRVNADVLSIPGAFQPLAFDTLIQFHLARTDRDGKATNGITRRASDKEFFSVPDRDVMFAAHGTDPWPADQYLNIWVCGRLLDANGITQLGYATFPKVSDGRDGIVVVHWAFGTVGTAEEPFNLGRTAVHEVGHWLNLHHIWGEAEGCGNDDFVIDTPPQEGPNFEFPTFPHVTCGNAPDGDMFMNYMDGTDDACMRMFTPFQTLWMHAALGHDRPGF